MGYFSPPPIRIDKYYRTPSFFNNYHRTPIPLEITIKILCDPCDVDGREKHTAIAGERKWKRKEISACCGV